MTAQRCLPLGRTIRLVTGCAVLAAGLALAERPAQAIDVHIDIGNAPPPPTFVFRSRPREVLDPGSRVYVVEDPRVSDYDLFHYGGYYWVFEDGYWYRSPSWRGRFVVVQPRVVPVVLYRVSGDRWKHGPPAVPPGLAKKPGGMPPGQYKKAYGDDDGPGHGRGRGHGHGR